MQEDLQERVAEYGWHHTIGLGNGVVTPGSDETPRNLTALHLPKFRFGPHPQEPFCFLWRMSESTFDFGSAAGHTTLARMLQLYPLFEWVGAKVLFRGDLICNMNDLASAGQVGLCGIAEQKGLIPDHDFVSTLAYSEARKFFSESKPSWSTRSDVPFWRGSSTGHREGDSLIQIPRAQLCLKGNELDYNFKISSIVRTDEGDRMLLYKSGIVGDYVSWHYLNKFKYNIDIDGNTSSWSGLFLKLLAGGVVLKVISKHDFRQWYYGRLRPWVNYVPIDADLGNLRCAIERLQADQPLAENIANEGRALACAMTYDAELARAAESIEELIRDV